MKSSLIQGIMSNAELSTVPEDGLALLGAGTSAGLVMTKFRSCILWDQHLEGLIAEEYQQLNWFTVILMT